MFSHSPSPTNKQPARVPVVGDSLSSPPIHKETVQPVLFENVTIPTPSPETPQGSIEELKVLSQQLFADDNLLPAAEKLTHHAEESVVQQSILTPKRQQRIAESPRRPYDGKQSLTAHVSTNYLTESGILTTRHQRTSNIKRFRTLRIEGQSIKFAWNVALYYLYRSLLQQSPVVNASAHLYVSSVPASVRFFQKWTTTTENTLHFLFAEVYFSTRRFSFKGLGLRNQPCRVSNAWLLSNDYIHYN